MQDFRWSSELISWKDLLLLLEGEPVKLPSPKNQFVTDVYIKTDMPIFATSKAKIEFVGKHSMRDNRDSPWDNVNFSGNCDHSGNQAYYISIERKFYVD